MSGDEPNMQTITIECHPFALHNRSRQGRLAKACARHAALAEGNPVGI